MVRMTAGWVPEWLSLPKLFRMVAAIIRRSVQIPNGQLLVCSCLRAYFSDRGPMVSAWVASLRRGQIGGGSEVTDSLPPTGYHARIGLRRGHAELIGERNG